MTSSIQILGFTEHETTCDRCGKSELKGTYAIDVEGQTLYLGSSCIAHKFEMTTNEVSRFITSEKKRIIEEKRTLIREIQKRKEIALAGIDFWNDYDLYVQIEKPFLEEIRNLN